MKHIILTSGFSALVDDEDKEWLDNYKWHVSADSKTYYALRTLRYTTRNKTTLSMSIEIMKYHNRYNDNLVVDHEDRNGLNNQKHNLRMVTRQINSMNRDLQSNNTSGFRGVSQHYDKWVSYMHINKRRIHIGIYDTKIEAAEAYNRVAKAVFNNHAILNIID